MKDITKKILESGLIDLNLVKLMERWGQLDPGSSNIVKGKLIKETAQSIIEDLEELLDEEPESKEEVHLDMVSTGIYESFYDWSGRSVTVLKDIAGRLIAPSDFFPKIGEKIYSVDSREHIVMNVEVAIKEDGVVNLITVEEV